MESTNSASNPKRRSRRRPFQAATLTHWICAAGLLLASACNFPQENISAPTATALAARQTLYAASYPSSTPESIATATATQIAPTQAPTYPPVATLPAPQPLITPTATPEISVPAGMLLYYSQSGDTLAAVAAHFRVDPSELQQPLSIGHDQYLPAGTAILAPNRFEVTPPYQQPVLPDSEVIYGPGSGSFDVSAWVDQAGGFLSDYTETVFDVPRSGAEIVEIVAVETSTNPRLLLAFLEYRSGWVFGWPEGAATEIYPIGYYAPSAPGLYGELMVTARILAQGYYGWREGTLFSLTFVDDSTAQIHPAINAGSAAVQNLFAALHKPADFLQALYGENGFTQRYQLIFGDAWSRSAQLGALLPPDLTQPELTLPFMPGLTWALTGGPHKAWQTGTPLGALDFAAKTGQKGCIVSSAWATAAAPGLVVRSAEGAVAIDLDGDGDEGTGWVLVYMHMAPEGRIPASSWVNLNDPIGHPSCEGGISTGSHLHLTRKYNGEWLAADGPAPMILDGWQAYTADSFSRGRLVRDGAVVLANPNGESESWITRDN